MAARFITPNHLAFESPVLTRLSTGRMLPAWSGQGGSRMKCQHFLLSVLFACVFALSSAWAAPTPISGCKRITVPGPHVLTQNITATAATMTPVWATGYVGCIVIAADNLTVDLAGYVITGPGRSASSMGIAQADIVRKGDVIRSGSVTNFKYGVTLRGPGHTVE